MENSYRSLEQEQRTKETKASEPLQKLLEYLQGSSDIEPGFRRLTIRTIIQDLSLHLEGRTDWSITTTFNALAALKLLGRSPVATEDITTHFPLLMSYANLVPAGSPTRESASTSSPSIVQESLRVLANALFLHPLSRSSSDLLPGLGGLVHSAVSLSEKSLDPPDETTCFLAARVIFLITAVASDLAVELVEKTRLVRGLEARLKRQVSQKLDPHTHACPPIPQDCLVEYLKIVFNLMVNYPKSVLQFDHTPAEPPARTSTSTAGSPLNDLDSSSSQDGAFPAGLPQARRLSLKQRFNNQINFKKFRFRTQSESSDSKDLPDDPGHPETDDDPHPPKKPFFQPSSSRALHRPSLSIDPADALGPVTSPANTVFAGLLPYLVQLFLLEPIPDPPTLKPPLQSYMQTFLNYLPTASWFYAAYPQVCGGTGRSEEAEGESAKVPAVVAKLVAIIERVTGHYCADDPDGAGTRERCRADGVDLDVDLAHVLLLATRLLQPAPPAGLASPARHTLIRALVPPSLDRHVPLNKQDNLVGRLLRLLNSVRFEALKLAVGALLVALYADDTERLARDVGYGPLAGYFVSIGKPWLGEPSSEEPGDPAINPITGAYWSAPDDTPAPPLSDADKEREADRLCHLFDRINRSAVISVQDPRNVALQAGRFEDIDLQLQAEDQRQDALDEQNALDELKRYKDRKSNAH